MGRRTAPQHTGKSILGAVGALCLAAALAACSSPAAAPGDSEKAASTEALSTAVLGAWVSNETGNPELVFLETGEVTGTDGCNGLTTTYTVEAGTITLAEFASTMRACQGVDVWLRAVREVTVDGNTLQVFNSNGDEIGTLERGV